MNSHAPPTVGASSTRAPVHFPLGLELALATLAGAAWALPAAWAAGLPLQAAIVLAGPAAITQWFLLAAWSILSADRRLRAQFACGASGLVVLAFGLGELLKQYTHHRPLGAVTWVLTCLVLAVPLAYTAARARAWPRLAEGGFVVVLLAATGLTVMQGAAGSLLQVGLGLGAFALSVYLRGRLQASGKATLPSWLPWPAASLIVAGFVGLLLSPERASWQEAVPLLFGLAALLG